MDSLRYLGSYKIENELYLTGPEEDFKRLINKIVYKIRCSHKQYG